MNDIREDHHEEGFYKGLVFGLLLGVGLVWFLGTKEGKKFKEELSGKGEEFIDKAKKSIDRALSEEFVQDDPSAPKLSEPAQPLSNYFEDRNP